MSILTSIIDAANPYSLAIKAGLAILAVSFVVGGYYYVKNLRHEVQLGQDQIAEKQRVIEAKDIQIKQNAEDAALSESLNTDISRKWAQAQSEKLALTKQLNGIGTNFSQMILEQPVQMETKINQNTQFMLRCNEIVTGAVILPDDDMNTICPNLIKAKKP